MKLVTERREISSPLLRFLTPIASIAVALFVAGFLLLASGVDPLAAYKDILFESLGSLYGLSETLVKTTPLIFAGLGVSLAFRMQIWNIGAEGQIYIGAMAASGVALFSGIDNHWLMMLMMFTAAFIAGGSWAGVAGFLRARWQVNEVIVTLLMNYIAILFVDYLIYGPWKDPKGFNFPLTAQFADGARLAEYFDTRLHSGFFLALFIALALYLFMERTVWGYQIKVIGSNPKAAQYAGMKTGATIFMVLFLSGAIAGIAGFSEVAGLQHRLQHGISPGYGYTAIIIAWLAKRSAIGVVIVSFLMGVLLVGGDSLQIYWQLPIALVFAFQGLILFFLLASDFFVQYRVKLVKGATMLEILLDATVRAGTPILFATLGAIINERAGIINLGIEGLMLIGALAGFAGTHASGSLFIGVLAAFSATFVAGSIHAFITVQLRGNQIVSGLAMTMFGIGITALFGKGMVGQTISGFERIAIPLLSDLPIVGKAIFNQNLLIYFSFLLVFTMGFFFYRTRWGLAVRTIGENPAAADTCGVPVNLYKFLAVTVGSGFVGIGGAYLSLASTPMWIENMSAGRGWIAVALVIFAGWSSPRAMLGAYLFGGITAMQLRFQAMGTTVSAHILQMLPYFFTIVVLVISTLRLQKGASQQPESLGLPYDREDRK